MNVVVHTIFCLIMTGIAICVISKFLIFFYIDGDGLIKWLVKKIRHKMITREKSVTVGEIIDIDGSVIEYTKVKIKKNRKINLWKIPIIRDIYYKY